MHAQWYKKMSQQRGEAYRLPPGPAVMYAPNTSPVSFQRQGPGKYGHVVSAGTCMARGRPAEAEAKHRRPYERKRLNLSYIYRSITFADYCCGCKEHTATHAATSLAVLAVSSGAGSQARKHCIIVKDIVISSHES